MVRFIGLSVVAGLVHIASVYAQSVPNCKDLTPAQHDSIHQECVTGQGVKFQRVDVAPLGAAWRDENTSLIWGNAYTFPSGEIDFVKQDVASRKCLELNSKIERRAIQSALDGGVLPDHGYFLPREADLDTSAGDGIEDVLPNIQDKNGYWFFWSSSTYSTGGIDVAAARTGQVYHWGQNMPHRYTNVTQAYRCVAR